MNIPLHLKDYIYDWNSEGTALPLQKIELHDETLRDGLQSPSVKIPTLDEQTEILKLMNKIGVSSVDLGFPAANPSVKQNVIHFLKVINKCQLKLVPCCIGRTLESDIIPIIDISAQSGMAIETMLFIGSSPLRQIIENWTFDSLVHQVKTTVSFASQHQLPVTLVTEDTTRSSPNQLEKLYLTAIEAGATRICICDTVGHITPEGTYKIIRFIVDLLKKNFREDIKIDFHGHMDRGLGLWNSIAAIKGGAHRIHGCGLGIGERCGNTPIDQLLINLKLLGWIDNDLKDLCEYVNLIAKYTGMTIPPSYPGLGSDAFTTATGIHASALLKAKKMGQEDLVDAVYSGVPASWFGLSQSIKIGPMSGKACVEHWLMERKYEHSSKAINKIISFVKKSNHVLANEEIFNLLLSA